jgi:Haem-binding domain
MRRAAKYIGLLLAIAFIGAQAIRPARTNPSVDGRRTVESFMPIAPAATDVIERACRDCHSNRTEWPWYSNVAPVSWFVINHVDHARSHLNFSEWASYSLDERRKLLDGSCNQARDGSMPLPSYTWIHWTARLSDADVDALCAWAGGAAQNSELKTQN